MRVQLLAQPRSIAEGPLALGDLPVPEPGPDELLLWWERTLRSVANYTRDDARKFLELAARVPVRTQVQLYGLAEANRALQDLAAGATEGTAVIVPEQG